MDLHFRGGENDGKVERSDRHVFKHGKTTVGSSTYTVTQLVPGLMYAYLPDREHPVTLSVTEPVDDIRFGKVTLEDRAHLTSLLFARLSRKASQVRGELIPESRRYLGTGEVGTKPDPVPGEVKAIGWAFVRGPAPADQDADAN